MRPILQPENIYAHPHQEQDVILWYNRALWHSIVSAVFYGIEPNKDRITIDIRRRSFQSPMGLE